MTIFDLIFALAFLACLVTIGVALLSAASGRRAKAVSALQFLAAFVAVYLGVVIAVSLLSPQPTLGVGEVRWSDDWGISVAKVNRSVKDDIAAYEVTLRLTSRALGRSQRERGVKVYVVDEAGRTYQPTPDPAAVGLDVLVDAKQSIDTTRVFDLPASASNPRLVITRWLSFPGCVVIGDADSLFHRRVAVPLPEGESRQ